MNIAENRYVLQVHFQCPVPYQDTVLTNLDVAVMTLEGYIGQALERTCGSMICIDDIKLRSTRLEEDGSENEEAGE